MIRNTLSLVFAALFAVSVVTPVHELQASPTTPAGVASFALPTPAASPFTTDLDCDYCFYSSDFLGRPDKHYFYGMGCIQGRGDVFQQTSRVAGSGFTSGTPVRGESAGGCKDCHAFNACHQDYPGQSAACDGSHWLCGATEGTELISSNPDEIPVMLEKALAAGSLKEISHVIGVSKLIQVNASRKLVQVLNCNGGVVAQYRMPAVMQKLVARSAAH